MSYQILIIFTPVFTVPYISRVIGPSGVGVIAYTNSIISYFVLIANLSLSLYGSRTISYNRDNEIEMYKSFYEIMTLKLIMVCISFLSLIIFIVIVPANTNLLLVQSIQILAVGVDISWLYIGREDFKNIAIRNISVKLCAVIMIFLFVKSSKDIYIYALINSGSVLLGNFFLWKEKIIKKIKEVKALNLKKHIYPILILVIPQIMTTFFVSMNRIFLGIFSNYQQTGFFDNSDKIIRILLAFISSVGTVFFPKVSAAYQAGNHQLARDYLRVSFNLVNLISFPIAFGLFLVSSDFSNIFFGTSFNGISNVLSVMGFELIFMGWSSIIGQQYLVAINKLSGVTVSMAISLLVSVILGILLIPKYGAVGASFVAVMGELIISVIQLLYLKKFVKIRYLFSDFWKICISFVIMIICVYAITKLNIENIFLKLFVEIFGGVISYACVILALKPDVLKVVRNVIKKNNFKF